MRGGGGGWGGQEGRRRGAEGTKVRQVALGAPDSNSLNFNADSLTHQGIQLVVGSPESATVASSGAPGARAAPEVSLEAGNFLIFFACQTISKIDKQPYIPHPTSNFLTVSRNC